MVARSRLREACPADRRRRRVTTVPWPPVRRLMLLIAIGAVGVAGAGAGASSAGGYQIPPAVAGSVNPAVVVGRVPPALLSLSTEYWAFEYSAGKNPKAVDPVFVQLLRNLDPG